MTKATSWLLGTSQLTLKQYSDTPLLEKPKKLSWSKQIHENFENIIQSSEAKDFISNFASKGINADQNSIDIATKLLTDFVVNSAIQADNTNPKMPTLNNFAPFHF